MRKSRIITLVAIKYYMDKGFIWSENICSYILQYRRDHEYYLSNIVKLLQSSTELFSYFIRKIQSSSKR